MYGENHKSCEGECEMERENVVEKNPATENDEVKGRAGITVTIIGTVEIINSSWIFRNLKSIGERKKRLLYHEQCSINTLATLKASLAFINTWMLKQISNNS